MQSCACASSEKVACSPSTGRRLRFAPVMSARAGLVELPMVAALFSDVVAPPGACQRAWRRAALPSAGSGSPCTPRTPRVRPGFCPQPTSCCTLRDPARPGSAIHTEVNTQCVLGTPRMRAHAICKRRSTLQTRSTVKQYQGDCGCAGDRTACRLPNTNKAPSCKSFFRTDQCHRPRACSDCGLEGCSGPGATCN